MGFWRARSSGVVAHACSPSGDLSVDRLELRSSRGSLHCVEAASALRAASTRGVWGSPHSPGCIMKGDNQRSGPKGSSQKPTRRAVAGQRC